MSSNQHHNENRISLDNYEEYFLLYMDQELTPAQVSMVEEFISLHPHLQAELDLLMDTRLSPETISFDKSALMAESMALPSAQEDLLLYMDNELPASKLNIVSLELASNAAYSDQLHELMKARLDAGELVPHPNKKELYRRTGSIVAFKPWMRVAAAVLLIAGLGTVYFTSQKSASTNGLATVPTQVQQTGSGENKIQNTLPVPEAQNNEAQIASATPELTERASRKVEQHSNPSVSPMIAKASEPRDVPEELIKDQAPMATLALTGHSIPDITNTAVNIPTDNNLLNNSAVTKALPIPSTITETNGGVKEDASVASNEKKGSVKGFLRKATRLIEKKTGIDPTSDGELLIGVVAVNLK